MTYHRTAGKGGTRNSARTKHIDEYAPNFNKTQGSGVNRRGRKQNNPPRKPKRSPIDAAEEYVGDAMLDFFNPRQIPTPPGFRSKKWRDKGT